MWAYLPDSVISACSRELKVLDWDSELPARMLAASCTSRGKVRSSSYWSRISGRGGWMTPLFGRISKLSTLDLSGAMSIWLQEGRPVSRSLWPGSAKGTTTSEPGATATDPCSTPAGSSTSVVPPWSSLRMFLPGWDPADSEASATSYAEWVTRSKALSSSVRRMLARRTSGKESSCWPTPNVPNGGRVMAEEDVLAKGATDRGKRQVPLASVAQMWPTPSVSASEQGANEPDGKRGQTLLGASQGQEWGYWPTPGATDGKGESQPVGRRPPCDDDLPSRVSRMWQTPNVKCSEDSQTHRSKERSSELLLNGQVQLWATPTSHERTLAPRDVDHGVQLANQVDLWASPATRDFRSSLASPETMERNARPLNEQVISSWASTKACDGHKPSAGKRATSDFSHQAQATRPGETSSKPPRGSRPPSQRKNLNPYFVEWLMGFPVGWTELTGCEPAGMQLYLSRLHWLSEYYLRESTSNEHRRNPN